MLFINFANWSLNAAIFMVLVRVYQMLFPESNSALTLGVMH